MGADGKQAGWRSQRIASGCPSRDIQSCRISTKNKSLQALTSAAMVLPGLMLQPAQGAEVDADSFGFQYYRYQEGKRNLYNVPNKLDPIMADVIHATGRLSLTDRVKFNFGYTRDTWSGATPVTSAPLAANGNRPILQNTPSGTVVSGASPTVNNRVLLDRDLNPIARDPLTGEVLGKDTRTVEILSFASPEVRNAADFGLGYEWNEAALHIGGGLSVEPDYESSFGNVSGRLDFNQKQTSLKFGLGYTSSDISAILDDDLVPYLTRDAFADQIKNRDGSEIFIGDRQDFTANLGLTQILTKQALVDTSIGYTHSSGYLGNPYKAMSVIFVDPATLSDNPDALIVGDVRALMEQRPGNRNQLAVSTKYVQHVSPLDAALHLDYKFSYDDWGIHTNTFTMDWVQPLGYGWTITPRIRYFSQGAADFYDPYLITQQAFNSNAVDASGREIWVDSNNPDVEYFRDDNFNLLDSNGNIVDESMLNVQPKIIPFDAEELPDDFSSDYRLAGFGSLSGGVTLSKRFAKGIKLQAGFEYYTRQSSLKLGGGGGTSFSDFDFYVANAAITIDIEKLNFSDSLGGGSSGLHAEHDTQAHQTHQAHQHGGALPAGVMNGHMLHKAGEFMFGYSYMHARTGGDILHGDNVASDQQIVTQGCSDDINCRFAPSYMNMNMHMLHIMYAPTDWMNLMLMPKFVDMNMNLRELEGRPPPQPGVHEHSGAAGHTTGGVGDTVMSSLVKLFNVPGHRMHLGLGFSAPTGDSGLEFRRVFQIDGGLVHFGMQLGSGTWDFLPSLTYAGDYRRWSWGAQLNGVKRMEDQNESGYRLGDIFQATSWGGYRLTNWLSASVRGIYTVQGDIHGDFNDFNGRAGPMDFPANHGGQFWDLGFGVNAAVPRGKFVGNELSFEWLQPIRDEVNGYRLERKSALAATWRYHF
jgi:Protein of unknown function (DUF3570)